MVEHLTADQEVPSSNLGAPYSAVDLTCCVAYSTVLSAMTHLNPLRDAIPQVYPKTYLGPALG